MFNSNTDKAWEKFGKNDPYFGVLTHSKYQKSNLTNENKEEFLNSGYIYIDSVLKKIKKHLDIDYQIIKALDFGCGVGRLIIPLAELAEKVTGIDVSVSMLNEAQKNCEARSLKNVSLLKSDDNLSLLKDKYNFVHSFIVFQHIPVKRGERIFEKLMAHLEDGGVCIIHFTYAKNYYIQKIVPFIKNTIPFAKNLVNLIKGRTFFAPQMQMNAYDLNKLFFIMQKSNIYEFHAEYTNHGGDLGIIVYFKKPKGHKALFTSACPPNVSPQSKATGEIACFL